MKNITNQVQLIGNLGANPELKKFDSGNAVCNFSIATNMKYKNQKGETVEETQWHKIVLWGKLAEFAAENLEKGNRILVDGRISTRNYKDDKGVIQYVTEIVANEMLILNGKAIAEPAAKRA